MKHIFILVTIVSLLFIAKPAYADGNDGQIEIACTPVYGMADTCVEHTPIDTGAADSIAYTLAGSSYLAGLAAFIKAKKSII